MKYLILILTLFACGPQGPQKQLINCEYPGGLILEDKSCGGCYVYAISYKGEIYNYVKVYEIDSHYKVGDIINKPCLNGGNEAEDEYYN